MSKSSKSADPTIYSESLHSAMVEYYRDGEDPVDSFTLRGASTDGGNYQLSLRQRDARFLLEALEAFKAWIEDERPGQYASFDPGE